MKPKYFGSGATGLIFENPAEVSTVIKALVESEKPELAELVRARILSHEQVILEVHPEIQAAAEEFGPLAGEVQAIEVERNFETDRRMNIVRQRSSVIPEEVDDVMGALRSAAFGSLGLSPAQQQTAIVMIEQYDT